MKDIFNDLIAMVLRWIQAAHNLLEEVQYLSQTDTWIDVQKSLVSCKTSIHCRLRQNRYIYVHFSQPSRLYVCT